MNIKTQKKELIKTIQGMILLTEDNRTTLLGLVKKTKSKKVLKEVQKITKEEQRGINFYLKSVVEAAVEAGDGEILKRMEKIFAKAAISIRKEEEVIEEKDSKEGAEDVLREL